MDFTNPLLMALNGVNGGAGRRAPGTTGFLNQQGQAAYEAEMQAQDTGNFARLAAQQGANPPATPAAQPNGYNRLLQALAPNQ